jgi:hypothetical protein
MTHNKPLGAKQMGAQGRMNPSHWKPEHQVGGVLTCVLGGVVGLLFAWAESPFRNLSIHSVSGEWSDYTTVFLTWLGSGHYWPWPLLGSVIARLAFYVWRLVSVPNSNGT